MTKISKSQIGLFLLVAFVWAGVRMMFSSTIPKFGEEGKFSGKASNNNYGVPESISSFTFSSSMKSEELLNSMEQQKQQAQNETESLNEAYRLLLFIASHTKSSKSRIEYDRVVEYSKKHIFSSKILPLPKIPAKYLENDVTKMTEGDASMKNGENEVCPEGEWPDNIFKYENKAPMFFPPFLQNECKVTAPLNSIVTLLFNFVNEIPLAKAKELFLDAAHCKYKNMRMIAIMRHVPPFTSYEELKEIANSHLPHMEIAMTSRETHVDVLSEAMDKITTKYVVLTRNIERFDNFSLIIRLVRDLSLGNAEAVGGAQRNFSGHWKAGCYQVKRRNDLLHFEEGYDESDNGCMYCDYLSSPFAVKLNNFKQYISRNFVRSSSLSGDFLYMEYFMWVRFTAKLNVFMCMDSMFYTETSGLQVIPRDESKWLSFLVKYKFSSVTAGFPDQKRRIEFPCSRVALSCGPPSSEAEAPNQCCVKEGEKYIKNVVKVLLENGVKYQFMLPTHRGPYWNLVKSGETTTSEYSLGKHIIPIKTSRGHGELKNILKMDGFEWEKPGQLSSANWLFDFVVLNSPSNDTSFKSGYSISFGDLYLPVDGFPGDSLKMGLHKPPYRSYLDLLFYYRDLRSQKIWM